MKRKIKVTMVSKAASVMDYNARVARGEGTQESGYRKDHSPFLHELHDFRGEIA